MHGGATANVIWILTLALVAGAATRMYSRRTRFPYTIAMLLVGIGVGLVIRWVASRGAATGLLAIVAEGHVLSPDLILFVFLPALVFESAFSLDAYAFRKELGTISLLAVPALIATTALAAAWMVGMTSMNWQWSWGAALVFGAMVSATDPVAVVALLREVGAPKRLGVLIEGESLLNDGTAIVLFGVLLQFLNAAADTTPGAGEVLVSFVTVVAGGVVVGLVVAIALSGWISRTFNDPMVEITLTMVIAYSSMMLAEGVLHVSGVIAVVTAGLWMSGLGKTRISPEVSDFLHHFWELLSYLANTLIFLLVGIVIAVQIGSATRNAVFVVGASFVGLVLIRFAVTFFFRPFIGLTGDRVSWGEAAVLSWSGLRGAVSLSLALAINQNPAVPRILREQLLIATAGVVLLTLLVNGGTIRWLLHKLGYDRRSPGEVLASLSAERSALRDVARRVHAVRESGDLVTVPWSRVEAELDGRSAELEQRFMTVQHEVDAAAEDPAAGYWRQALEMERKSYWRSYNRGFLGARAVRILAHEIDLQLDRLHRGEMEPPSRRVPTLVGLRPALARLWRHLGLGSGFLERGRLSLSYDLSSAESRVARELLDKLGKLEGAAPDIVETLERTYRQYAYSGKEALEEIRSNLPEVSRIIETRLAGRIALNFEREAIEELERAGVVDERAARGLLADIEQRMKILWRERGKVALPDFQELTASIPLFRRLDRATIDQIASLSREQVLAADEILFEQGDKGDSMYIIARGAAYVHRVVEGKEPVLYGVLGGGEIVGEMALLTGESRSATVRAATTLTVFRIARDDFDDLIESRPAAEQEIWHAFAAHTFDNLVRKLPEYAWMSRETRLAWLERGEELLLREADRVPLDTAARLFLVWGVVLVAGRTYSAPALIEIVDEMEEVRVASPQARVVRLEPGETDASRAG